MKRLEHQSYQFIYIVSLNNLIINQNHSDMQQEIQRLQHTRNFFLKGGVRYNIQSSTWREVKCKSTGQTQQSFLNLPYQCYAILKNSIFCLNYTTTNPSKASLISFNFVTEEIKQWKQQVDTNTPQFRNNYTMINYDGRLCIFGGETPNNVYLDDFISFTTYSNQWAPVLKQNNTTLPSPRIPFIFTEVQGGNLLLFGGLNGNGFVRDAFLFMNKVWKPLNILNIQNIEAKFGNVEQIIRRQGIRFCGGKDGVYLFGGKIQGQFTNNFYKMKVNEDNLTLTIQEISSDFGSRPRGRASHAMTRINSNCFALYGGICQTGGLKDISIFDTNQLKWMEVFPLNGILPYLDSPGMYSNGNNLYISGTLTQTISAKKCIIQLAFSEYQIIKSEICSNCTKRLQIKQKEENHGPKKPFISNGLLYNMAMQLKFPYHGISLIMDCASILKATQVVIKSEQTNKTSNKLTYLKISFNGTSLNRDQYNSFISHSYLSDPIVLAIVDQLKLGSLRLGKTLVYISTYEDKRRVFVFSTDGLVISHYHELYAYFSYQERITDQWVTTQQGINHRKFILNFLQSYFDRPNDIISSVVNHCMLIFEGNVIMTTQKIYYQEIIAINDDIIQCKTNKKVEFLDKLGFQLNSDPEVSLSSYLQYLYLQPKIKNIHIQNKNTDLVSHKYKRQLENLQKSSELKKLCDDIITAVGIQAECLLYQVMDQGKYIPDLKGILIYYQGRLINRFQVQFGDLFWQRFYKIKYKKAFGLWSYVGVINFTKGIEVKSLKNQFKNNNLFSSFMRHIKRQYWSKNNCLKISPEEEGVDEQWKAGKSGKKQ